MRTAAGFALVLVFAACAAPMPRPEPAALEARAELPPHVVEVAYGLYSCERGYVIRQGCCISLADIPPGPVVEISSLPSAGDGAPRICPSGGCGSYVMPTYLTSYSAPAYGYPWYGYGGWPGFYYGSRFCAPHVRRFRGGELAFAGFGSFGRERRLAPAGFFGAPPRQSPAVRRSTGGRFFAGSSRGVAAQRSARGGAWR